MITSNLHHVITHWAVIGSDGYGGFTFNSPTTFFARWEDKNELYKDSQNEEHVSNAIVYMIDAVGVGDYIALGSYLTNSTPLDVPGAYRVGQYNRTTDLRNLNVLRKVFL